MPARMYLLALVLALHACKKSEPLFFGASAAWDTQCGGPLVFKTKANRPVTVTVAGSSAKSDANGATDLNMPSADARKLPAQVEVVATEDNGTQAKVMVQVPAFTPRRPIERGSTSGFDDVTATYTFRGAQEKISLGRGGDVKPKKKLSLELVACGLVPAKIDRGHTKIEVTADAVRVDIDVYAMHVSAVDAVPEKLAITVPVQTTEGQRFDVALQTPIPGAWAFDDLHTRWRSVAATPIPEAPLPKDVPTPRPIITFDYNGRISRALLGSSSIATAPYVALRRETTRQPVGKCGPYAEFHYATTFQVTTEVKLYEARTGKLVAQNAFPGRYPPCPDKITYQKGTAPPDKLDGAADEAAIDAWLAGYRR